MRRLFTILLLAMLVFPIIGLAKKTEVVLFDDAVLEAEIRNKLSIPTGDVTDKDMAKITKLEIDRQYEQEPDSSTQVKSIAVLSYCKNLKDLQLNFQSITDISPLAKLTKLKNLGLGGNPIANIAALSGLAGLENLALFNCQARDYSSLKNLKKLKYLLLEFSTINNLEPLSGLTKLQTLSLMDTPITDVAPLATLKALRTLKLANCNITDYSPLEIIYPKLKEKDFDLTNSIPEVKSEVIVFDDPVLEKIIRDAAGKQKGDVFADDLNRITDLGTGLDYRENPPEGTQVQSIEALKYCKNLERLGLNFNRITDISPLSGLTELKILELGGNPITDITPLTGLTKLETLMLFNCQATDYSALSNLVNLKELYLEYSTIFDLAPLSGLTKLEELGLKETAVTNVEPLKNLTSLRLLNLAGCMILDYAPIKDLLPNLVEMDFDPDRSVAMIAFSDSALEKAIRKSMGIPEGEITNVQAQQVEELRLNFNPQYPEEITNIDSLRYFTGLKLLEIQNNPVTDLSPLSALTNLDRLDLTGCKATDYSPLENLQQLKDLILANSNIKDLTPLSMLTGLEILNLRNTNVSDITPLTGLTNLLGLHLEGSLVTDLSPVHEIYLNLKKCDFDMAKEGDVQFTDSMLEERIRNEMGKPEGDITIDEAKSVERLNLGQDWQNSDTSIHSLASLRFFTGLEELSIAGNRSINNLTPLSSLTSLKVLDFCWCDVSDITPLQNLTELQVLVFGWGNHVESLNALSGMISLEAIDAKNAGIKDVSGLAGLPKLFEVQLCDNEITDVAPFAQIPNLKILLLINNPITDYSPLARIADNLEKDFDVKE